MYGKNAVYLELNVSFNGTISNCLYAGTEFYFEVEATTTQSISKLSNELKSGNYVLRVDGVSPYCSRWLEMKQSASNTFTYNGDVLDYKSLGAKVTCKALNSTAREFAYEINARTYNSNGAYDVIVERTYFNTAGQVHPFEMSYDSNQPYWEGVVLVNIY